MLKLPLIRRQIAASAHQSILFVLCVALSLVTLVSLGGFSRSVHSSLLKDARVLHAADIIIHSHAPLSQPLLGQVSALEKNREIETARWYEFYSVVQSAKKDASLLSNLKVVDPGYPFYGTVDLASGRPFREVLTPGSAIVEQALLDRMHLKVGDLLGVGSAKLVIKDVVLQEPDRPINIFSLGPRIFIASHDLASLALLGMGSRANYTLLVKVADEDRLDQIAAKLKTAALSDRERIETYKTADSGVKRFFDNFLFFLNLIGIFTLLLAGIGIQSSLTAFLEEQEQTIAIMKALGARSPFILRNYLAVVSVLGLAGTIFGLAASFLLEKILPGLFHGLLPASLSLAISPTAIIEGLALGLIVVLLFTLLPLLRLKEVKPRAIFTKETLPAQDRYSRMATGLVMLFFLVMVLTRVREVKIGLYFVLGVIGLITIAFLFTETLLRSLRGRATPNLVLRQAMKGLFRPRNETRAIITMLTAALAVIFSITLVERNLDATFVQSYPPDSPNVFFIDIQPGQKQAFAKALGTPAIFYPVVRGAISDINGDRIDRDEEHRKRSDNLGREFSLTYRETLLGDERIVQGTSLFDAHWTGPQVSVLDTVQKMRDMKIGDVITFLVQGIPISARISSIRTRTHASLQPFFYFVFPDSVLGDAPQTFFTALRLDKAKISPLQNRIVAQFPNVSVIDVTETISVFSSIMSRLSRIVNFFTLFSVVAGMLIIVSSTFATRHTRVRESVYFTILGARSRFVLAVFSLESLIIGLASGMFAFAISEASAWAICRFALEVAYTPFAGLILILVIGVSLLVVAVALVSSIPVLRKRPAAFLREQTEE